MPWPDAILRMSVRSESAKIDVNAAPKELLMGLFANLLPAADAEALADAVIYTRQGGEEEEPEPERSAQPARRGQSADAASRLAKKPKKATQPFATVDTLVQVPGLDPASVERLRPYITVYSGSAKIDASTADLEVLAAIPGVSRDTALRFMEERMAPTRDTQRIDLSSLGAVTDYVEARPGAKVTNIRAAAYLAGGASATVEAVVIPGGSAGVTVLEWREGSVRPSAWWGFQ
jgi:general secretion pathway protein K